MQHRLLFRDFDIHEIVQTMDKEDAVVVPGFLRNWIRLGLLRELTECAFTVRQEMSGKRKVRFLYEEVAVFRKGGLFERVGDALEELLQQKLLLHDPYPLLKPLRFMDRVVQRYLPNEEEIGISAHQDGPWYEGIIVVVVLKEDGRFRLCDDRNGTNSRSIPHHSGDLILMRAPGFLGSEKQPFHLVDQIAGERVTYGLRCGVHP